MTPIVKGEAGEVIVISEASRRGYSVSLPLSKNLKYDLVVERNGKLEKIQVKTTSPNKDGALHVPMKTCIYDKTFGTNNRNRTIKYKEGDFDWLVVVNALDNSCYFVPAIEVTGMAQFNLRLKPAKNNQRKHTHLAENYKVW